MSRAADGTGSVRFDRRDATAFITFDRPAARNAMTEAMYAQFVARLDRAAAEPGLRVVALRGQGGTFVAGTDISRFTTFDSGEDGLRYERRIESVIAALEALPVPTIAIVEGHAAGAGLMIAAACDLRLCTPDARFGVPIARTVGNCLSMASTARLLAHFGVARTKALLLDARFMSADDALDAGFVLEIVETDRLDDRVDELCERIASHSPVSIAVTREAIRRIVNAELPDGDDLIRRAYESADFHEGVAAFLAKRSPSWRGQ